MSEKHGEYEGHPIELIEEGLVGGGLFKAGPYLIACTYGVAPLQSWAHVSGDNDKSRAKVLETWSEMQEEMHYAIYG